MLFSCLSRQFAAGISVLVLTVSTVTAGPPVTQENLTQLLDLKIAEPAIITKINQDGINFKPTPEYLTSLANTGVSQELLDAVNAAHTKKNPVAPVNPITFANALQLVQLGIGEAAILERVNQAPTLFILDAQQEQQLLAAGATPRVIAALKGDRQSPSAASDITDIAVILDCSGSMKAATAEGESKMSAARRVVSELINDVPNGLNLTFIVYGHNAADKCEAVQIVRPLGRLDDQGKQQLSSLISTLRPAGSTPIANALHRAGTELAKAQTACGVILISDGKETCGGNPEAEAAALTTRLNLAFGAHVIGFDVSNEERTALTKIAVAGNGKYHNAANAAELGEALRQVQREITVSAKPEQRAGEGLELQAESITPGVFFHQAPRVKAGEFKGGLDFMDAHYYQIPLRAGQQLRAIGTIQKQAYRASNNRVSQTFAVTIFDGNFVPVERAAEKVNGNPTTPASVRATWTAPADTIAYVAISASDNHHDGVHYDLYKSDPSPAPYKLRLRVSGEGTVAPTVNAARRTDVSAGRGFASAGIMRQNTLTGADLKLGEMAFFRTRVSAGQKLHFGVGLQKPWYSVVNWFSGGKSQATYTVCLYDDDQFKVAEKKIVVSGNRPDAVGATLAFEAELDGWAWISITCDNTGNAVVKDEDPAPGFVTVQIQ